MARNKLVETFIEVAGDEEAATDMVNQGLGTRHPRRKLIEWRNCVVKTPWAAAELMRWHVIHAVLDQDVAEALVPMLGIEPPDVDGDEGR